MPTVHVGLVRRTTNPCRTTGSTLGDPKIGLMGRSGKAMWREGMVLWHQGTPLWTDKGRFAGRGNILERQKGSVIALHKPRPPGDQRRSVRGTSLVQVRHGSRSTGRQGRLTWP